MNKFLYWALFLGCAFQFGSAFFAAYLLARLYVWKRDRLYMWLLSVKAGFILTAGVLLWVLMPQATTTPTVEPNLRSWLYLAGIALSGIGIFGVALYHRDQYIEEETRQRG